METEKTEENGKKRKKTEEIGSDTVPATPFAKSRFKLPLERCRGTRGCRSYTVACRAAGALSPEERGCAKLKGAAARFNDSLLPAL